MLQTFCSIFCYADYGNSFVDQKDEIAAASPKKFKSILNEFDGMHKHGILLYDCLHFTSSYPTSGGIVTLLLNLTELW